MRCLMTMRHYLTVGALFCLAIVSSTFAILCEFFRGFCRGHAHRGR